MAGCINLWDPDSQLYAHPFLSKGLSADTSAAYGLMAFTGDNPRLKLVLTGRFPKGSYMSLQLYRGSFQSSEEVGGVLSDYNIAPSTGKNPYQTHNPSDTGTFKIAITPDPKAKGNSIWYDATPSPGLSRLISAFYRVYQPEGGQISFNDLPTIEARDYETNAVITCPVYQRLDWYLQLPGDIITFANDVTQLLGLVDDDLKFRVQKESAGTNADARYAFTFKNIPVGNVAVVEFVAPAIDFASPKGVSKTTEAVRYWSICSIYWPMLKTLNGIACNWSKPAGRKVRVVFGPDKLKIREKAAKIGADFLIDDRDPASNQRVMGFIVRNVLWSKAFEKKMFEGEYLPSGKVYSEKDFLLKKFD
jgi:hypothetical protein